MSTETTQSRQWRRLATPIRHGDGVIATTDQPTNGVAR